LLETLEHSRDKIIDFKVAGDWRIYCEMLLSPRAEVVYRHRAHNVHRRHPASVTHSLDASRHLEEIARVQQYAAAACSPSEPVARARSAYLDAVTGQLLASPKMSTASMPDERESLTHSTAPCPPEIHDQHQR
jgi:hypothetical protein